MSNKKMVTYTATTLHQFAELGKPFNLGFAPDTVHVRRFGEYAELEAPEIGEAASTLYVEIFRVSDREFKFLRVSPGVICVFTSADAAAPYSIGGAGAHPAVFLRSSENAILSHALFQKSGAAAAPIAWELDAKIHAASPLPHAHGDLDVAVCVDGTLTAVCYTRHVEADILVTLPSDATLYVRVEFDCPADPVPRVALKAGSTPGSYVSGDLMGTPELILPDGTRARIYETTPAHTSIQVRGASESSATTIECNLRAEDVQGCLPVLMAAFKIEAGESIAYLWIQARLDPVVVELEISCPQGLVAIDIRERARIPWGAVIEGAVVVNGEKKEVNECVEYHIQMTGDLTLLAHASGYAEKKYEIAFIADGQSYSVTAKFVRGSLAPTCSRVYTASGMDAFIPVSMIFPHSYESIEVRPRTDGARVEQRKPWGSRAGTDSVLAQHAIMTTYVVISAGALSKGKFAFDVHLDAVKLTEFELEVVTTKHMISKEEQVQPVDLGKNQFALRRKVEYVWIEEEDPDGKVSTEGCFQAGSVMDYPNIAQLLIEGPMVTMDICTLNASKIPKVRYAWLKDEKTADWGKIKFEVRPLAGVDDIVSQAGQGSVLNVQDNDYNPYGIVRSVSYSVDDEEFTPTLKLVNDQVTVNGDARGVLKIQPTRTFEGEAFTQKIVVRLSSAPEPPATVGAVEDVPLTVRFTASYGRQAHVRYDAIAPVGLTRGSLWKDSSAGPLFEVKHFVLRSRAYGAGDIAYFPTGLVQICADGSYVFSPNVNAKQEGSIGDIFCYGDVGSPAVLSLQRTVVHAGPYAIRSAPGQKAAFNLGLGEDMVVQDYRPITEQKRHISAGSKLDWGEGYFTCSKDGRGYIRAVNETFTPVMIRILHKGALRACLVNISVCSAEEAVRRHYTHEGQLLEGRPAGTSVTSYVLYSGQEKDGLSQVPVGQTCELDSEAAVIVQEDGSFRAWVSTANSTPLSIAYRFVREGVSGRGSGVLVGGAGAVAERARSPSTDARPTFAPDRRRTLDSSQTMQSSQVVRSSSLSGSTMAAGLLRDRSPSVLHRAAQWYPMYPHGTILAAHIVSDAGASNFEAVPVGDRLAFRLRTKEEVLTVGGCVFRAVAFSMPETCTVAACQGLNAVIPSLDGARDIYYDVSPDFELVASKGVVRIRVIGQIVAPRTVKVWGIFRKEAMEPEFVHATEIQLVPARISPAELRFSPAHGVRVRDPLRLGTFNPFEIVSPGVFTRKEGCAATVILSIPGGSSEAEVNFIADETVAGVVDLIPGVATFVTLDAGGERTLKILSEADMIFSPTAQSALALASIATQAVNPALSRERGSSLATSRRDLPDVESVVSPLVPPVATPPEFSPMEKMAMLRSRAEAIRLQFGKAQEATASHPQERQVSSAPEANIPRSLAPQTVQASAVNDKLAELRAVREAMQKKAVEEAASRNAAGESKSQPPPASATTVTSTAPQGSQRATAAPPQSRALPVTQVAEPQVSANPNVAAMQMMRARLQANETSTRFQQSHETGPQAVSQTRNLPELSVPTPAHQTPLARIQAIKDQMGARVPAARGVSDPSTAVAHGISGSQAAATTVQEAALAAATAVQEVAQATAAAVQEAAHRSAEAGYIAAENAFRASEMAARRAAAEIAAAAASAGHTLSSTRSLAHPDGTAAIDRVSEPPRPTGVVRASRTSVPPVVRVQRAARAPAPLARPAAALMPTAHVASRQEAARPLVRFAEQTRTMTMARPVVTLEYVGAISAPDAVARDAARASLPTDVRTAGALKKIFNSTPQSRTAAANLAQRTAGSASRGLPSQIRDVFAGVPVPCSVFGLDASEQESASSVPLPGRGARQTQPLQWAGPQGGCIALPGAVVFLISGTYVMGYTEDGRTQKITCNVRIHETWRHSQAQDPGQFSTEAYVGPQHHIASGQLVLAAWSMAYNEDAPRACAVSNGSIRHDRTAPCFAVTYTSAPDCRHGSAIWTVYVC
jgi:hypothetical protein